MKQRKLQIYEYTKSITDAKLLAQNLKSIARNKDREQEINKSNKFNKKQV